MTRRTALVTGSSSGIGLAVAEKLLAEGIVVALNSFEPEAAVGEVVARLKGIGEAAYFSADLSDPAAAYGLVGRVAEALGPVDILVNNAGVQKVSPVADFPPEDWDRLLGINLDAAFHTMRAALPGMTGRGWGRVVNIASAHGLRASPFKSAYVAAKHGLVGLTKSAALEVAEQGVTVNAVCPGYVWTPLVARQIADQAKAHNMSEEEVVRNVILAPQPTRRFVQPDEVADLVFYLCGEQSRSITGASISIDGGWTAK